MFPLSIQGPQAICITPHLEAVLIPSAVGPSFCLGCPHPPLELTKWYFVPEQETRDVRCNTGGRKEKNKKPHLTSCVFSGSVTALNASNN